MRTESIHRASNLKPATGLLLRRSPTTQRSSRIPWPRPFHISGSMGPIDEFARSGKVKSNHTRQGYWGPETRGIWVRGCFPGQCDSVDRWIDPSIQTRGSRLESWKRLQPLFPEEEHGADGPNRVEIRACVPVLSEPMSSVHQSIDEQEGSRFTALFAA